MLEGDGCEEAVSQLGALSEDAEWAVHFLLVGGLDAIARQLEKLALLAEPSAEQATLMHAMVSRLRVLVNEEQLGMIAAIGNAADIADLRRACGVDEPFVRPQESTDPGSPTLSALALCLSTARGTDMRVHLDVVPLLVAAAEDSASSHAALLIAFDRAAKVRGNGQARFAALVQCCRAPADGGELEAASRALALLNALISSPARLSARMALRDECAKLGVLKHVDALKAVVSAAGEEGGSGPTSHLQAHLKLFASELAGDERDLLIERQPLEEFAGECVVLFTSIVSNKISDDDWHKLEVLLKSKGVGFHGVDGSLPERKKAREALWSVSGDRSYPQVFVDKKYVGGYFKVVQMVEADEAHEQAGQRLESARKSSPGSPGSPRSSPKKNPWAGQMRKKGHLPRGVGFISTFNAYLGKETYVETVKLGKASSWGE